MTYHFGIYNTLLLVSACLTAMLAAFAWRGRSTSGAGAFAMLMVSSSFYSFGYALELAAPTLEAMLIWSKFQYLGIPVIAPLWLIVSFRYTGNDRYLTRSVYIALFLIPLATFILRLTNEHHSFFYQAVSMSTRGPFSILNITRGMWYWVNTSYTNLSVLTGTVLIFRMWLRMSSSYRRQATFMLAGALAPWAGNIIYLVGISPWGLDLTPFALTLTGPLFAWALFRHRLLDLVPVARHAVVEGMRDGVIVLDIQNRVVDFNHSAVEIIPELTRKQIGTYASEVLIGYPDLLEQINLDIQELMEIKIPPGKNCRYFTSRSSPVKNRYGIMLGKTIVLTDTTRTIQLFETMRSLATIDDLTGIYNRRHFLELAERELDRIKRYQRPASMLLLDIDHFKQINDTRGHAAGDVVLRSVARLCAASLRTTDIIGRYGGEEFTILLQETLSHDAFIIAERLRQKISGSPIELQDLSTVTVTASIGVAGFVLVPEMNLENLVASADKAMYAAKNAGRNTTMMAPGNKNS